ncbi:hypothetical protein OWR29_19035 [Actinoplanes sp. Pm04-4]|uniref:Uncharacterized protein n=1 Tax=Paractinoplanes pyxinae TaxID=2997416 RepID=A0ABT4B0T1_9ACTN|nr:hypothetical protein [Actinoplanes pyxinae]MCY1140103.1 hypothetical protein [Actinoplanes pyxinae]
MKDAKASGVSFSEKSLSDWLGGISVPRTDAPVTFLSKYLGALAQRQGRPVHLEIWWLDLVRRARAKRKAGRPRTRESARLQPDAGWPRVRELGPLDVGVHPAAFLPVSSSPLRSWFEGRPEPDAVPAYVPRDHDRSLQDSLRAAAKRSAGAVLVTGRSCAGKSRSAWEAVSAEFGDWQFVDMRDRDGRDRLAAASPDGDHVLWLDNLDRADDMSDVAESALRAMRQATPARRCVVVASMWRRPETIGGPGAAAVRELARLAGVPVSVLEGWSRRELETAAESAREDRLMAAALSQAAPSPPQLLAGARWALGLWRNPDHRETRAVRALSRRALVGAPRG